MGSYFDKHINYAITERHVKYSYSYLKKIFLNIPFYAMIILVK